MATNRELEIKKSITDKLSRNFGTTPELALDDQMYNATLLTIRDILMQKNAEFEQEVKKGNVEITVIEKTPWYKRIFSWLRK